MLLYLASTSPRRRQLLAAAGIEHRLVEPGPEPVAAGSPAQRAGRRARDKAVLATPRGPAGLVLGVDTVVDVDGRELGKPVDADAAARTLRILVGREHQVHSAVHLRPHPAAGDLGWSALATATVRFGPADDERIAALVRTGLWRGKAGGYGIQDREVADLVALIAGELDTVIGLPVSLLRELLTRAAEAGD